MSTVLDITNFIYNTGTLTIAPGDTTAVFSGTSLASSVKDGDYLFAGGSLAVIQTVTDDTHVDLFTEWTGAGVSAGPYLILKASLLRYHTALIGYDSASFLAMLDGTAVWYAVEGAAPDPSVGEDGNRALKSNVTPWVVWLKTGGVWVEQAGSPGGPGATILVQDADPDTSHPNNSLWIDSDSADLDVYALTGSPLAWTNTGMNLKGATGPASLKPIEAWVTATAYVTGPPASFVSQAGSAYECLIPHTSGTFATDLAAGKWGIVAAKGADGTGAGDVVGPSSAVDGRLAAFDTATGKLLKDSGKSVSDFATSAQAVPAGGTTGQLLAKVDGTDNNAHWIDAPNTDIASVVHSATSKTTPVDADEFAIVDSAASNVLKKLTWENLKAGLAAFVGDSGSGGTKGVVPAPAAGDAAAGKFLKADGTWAVSAGGTSAASQADMEAATSNTVAVTPGVQHFHPAHSKGFYRANITPTAVSGNVSSENTTTDQITWSAAHGLVTGDVIIPDGGTWATGVTVGAAYYVNAVSTTVFTLHLLRQYADAGTTPVNLTATGSGTRTMKKIVHSATIGFGMQSVSPIGFIGGQTSIQPEASLTGLQSAGVSASSMTIQGIVNTSGNPGLGYVGVASGTVGATYTTLQFDTTRILVLVAGASPTIAGTWTQQGTTTMRFVFEVKTDFV